MANISRHPIEEAIVARLLTITDMKSAQTSTIPKMTAENVHHPPGCLVAWIGDQLSDEDQPVWYPSRRMEATFRVLLVARNARTDTGLEEGIHSLFAEILDKMFYWKPAISEVERPFMYESAEPASSPDELVAFSIDFSTLVVVEQQP